jgi:hypothetical protein
MRQLIKMKIIDGNGRERNAAYAKKIIHRVPDKVTGEMVDMDFVEVRILGKVRAWKEYYPLEDFIKCNPNIEL